MATKTVPPRNLPNFDAINNASAFPISIPECGIFNEEAEFNDSEYFIEKVKGDDALGVFFSEHYCAIAGITSIPRPAPKSTIYKIYLYKRVEDHRDVKIFTEWKHKLPAQFNKTQLDDLNYYLAKNPEKFMPTILKKQFKAENYLLIIIPQVDNMLTFLNTNYNSIYCIVAYFTEALTLAFRLYLYKTKAEYREGVLFKKWAKYQLTNLPIETIILLSTTPTRWKSTIKKETYAEFDSIIIQNLYFAIKYLEENYDRVISFEYVGNTLTSGIRIDLIKTN